MSSTSCGPGKITAWPCVASQDLTCMGMWPLCPPSDSGWTISSHLMVPASSPSRPTRGTPLGHRERRQATSATQQPHLFQQPSPALLTQHPTFRGPRGRRHSSQGPALQQLSPGKQNKENICSLTSKAQNMHVSGALHLAVCLSLAGGPLPARPSSVCCPNQVL